jgi:hypothetical protein
MFQDFGFIALNLTSISGWKTPRDACEITIEGKNKWKNLIQNASKKS